MADLNLMPGAWRVEIVETVRKSVWVIADTPSEAKHLAEVQSLAHGAVSAKATKCCAPTIQEAGKWFAMFGRSQSRTAA